MTIYIFAPDRKVPKQLLAIPAIADELGDHRLRPWVRLVSEERRWKRTDTYVSERVVPETLAFRLNADVAYLPEQAERLSRWLLDRQEAKFDTWVRLAASTDRDTMAALAPAPTLEMF